ncbi:MAG: hypothetical protein U9Q33_13340 [Campylobacterota bacterium]|nr:hypothetical protein [Campylobacterota bacterium]
MKRKAVVLLITLFFITAISLLILKNLEDSNSFIEETAMDTKLSQIKITHNNIKDEVINLANRYKSNTDEILEITSQGIPFKYGDISFDLTLDDHISGDCYLNGIDQNNTLYDICSTDTINKIVYQYDFIKMLEQYKPFSSKDQLEYFLQKYKELTRDDRIDEVKDSFSFIKPLDENSTKRYLQCNYKAVIKDMKVKGEFIFEVETKKIVSSQLISSY